MALARRVGLGRLAVRDGACAQHLVLEAAGQSHDTVLALVLGEERGAGGVAGRGGGEAGDLEGVGVVRVRVRAAGYCVCGRVVSRECMRVRATRLWCRVCVCSTESCGACCVSKRERSVCGRACVAYCVYGE